MRRRSVLVGATLIIVLLAATPAWAHVEFSPESVPAGAATPVTLDVANERDGAGIVKVELHFPDDQEVVLAALPDIEGWTTEVRGGEVGGPVTDVVWTRPNTTSSDDVELSLTLGPFPDGAARLQFPAIETYSDGTTDDWIQEWPEGQPEPEMPAPLLEVTGTGPSTTEPSTTTVTGAPSTTIAPSPSTTVESGDDDSNTGLIVGLVVAAVAVAGGLTAYFLRRRARS